MSLPLLGLALALGAGPVSSRPPLDGPEALLLGTADEAGTLSTFWVEQGVLEKLGDGLAVPFDGAFGRLESVTVRKRNAVVRALRMRLAGRHSAAASVPKGRTGCRGSDVTLLVSVTSRHLSLQRLEDWTCPEPEKPERRSRLATLALGGVEMDTSKGLSIEAVLPALGRERLRDAGTAAAGKDPCLGAADPLRWAILHRAGRWTVQGELPGSDAACSERLFDVPLDLPEKLVGLHGQPQGWEDWQARWPEFVDVLEAPSGRFAVGLTANGLVLTGPDQAPKGVDAREQQIILARWVFGPEVERWHEAAARALDREETPAPP